MARNPVFPMFRSKHRTSSNVSFRVGSGVASKPASRIIKTPLARMASSACKCRRHIMSTTTSAGKLLRRDFRYRPTGVSKICPD